ncbi:MAG: glucokinase [Gammaproteobacteria bacterium]
MRVLAGDIGGTKTLLALVECDGNHCTILHKARYASADYTHLIPMLTLFLAESGEPAPARACFAVAGPVAIRGKGQTAQLTNLLWKLDTADLSSTLNIKHVRLVNDFQSVAYGIEALHDQDLITLQKGNPQAQEPRAIIGAGTGLGQAVLCWHGDRYNAIPSEGGHTDFAPQDIDQIGLLSKLMGDFGHVSYERLLSGSGLARIYWHLQQRSNQPSLPELETPGIDVASAVSRMALQDKDPVARQALDMFVAIYGAQAGNLALTVLARGGVYLAGGIAPKILPKLTDGSFIAAFTNKGRMAEVNRSIPVYVIGNPETGLLGAALLAGRL